MIEEIVDHILCVLNNSPAMLTVWFLRTMICMAVLAVISIIVRNIHYEILVLLSQKYPGKVKSPSKRQGTKLREVARYYVKSLPAIIILWHITDMLPISVAWGMWIAAGWIIYWNFPCVGLRHWEGLISGGWIIFNREAARIFSGTYWYVKYEIIYAGAVLMLLKYILLPMYVPENAAFIEEIVLLAIVLYCVWYFPFVGPVALWHIFPKEWPERDYPAGRDIPARINFFLKNGEAHIKISKCAAALTGTAIVTVVRGHIDLHRFDFQVEPGKDFDETMGFGTYYGRLLNHVWYTDLTIIISSPGELRGIRTFYPENRGMSQRILERIYSLHSALKERMGL